MAPLVQPTYQLGGALVFIFLATAWVTQLFAIILPGWVIVDGEKYDNVDILGSFFYTQGLWATCKIRKWLSVEEDCGSDVDLMGYRNEPWFRATKGLLLASCILVFLATIATYFYLSMDRLYKRKMVIIAIAVDAFLSAVLLLSAIIVFAEKAKPIMDDIGAVLCYCFYFDTIALVITIIGGFLAVVELVSIGPNTWQRFYSDIGHQGPPENYSRGSVVDIPKPKLVFTITDEAHAS